MKVLACDGIHEDGLAMFDEYRFDWPERLVVEAILDAERNWPSRLGPLPDRVPGAEIAQKYTAAPAQSTVRPKLRPPRRR